MKKIASDISTMQDEYDVIVIGSGYGGAISASRMARAGKKVCLLERGKEILPGDYPDTEVEAMAEMHLQTAKGDVGTKTGLYNIHVHEQQNVLVGCGLGGTSLINANVSLQAKPLVFEDQRWPQQIRDDQDGLLAQGYDRARDMLKPTPYPDTAPQLPKLSAHQKSAQSMQQPFYRPPINVTFESPEDGINHVGVKQAACNYCGDCVSGCNVGAKNTTLMNYLPDAHNFGADIFCEVSVKSLQQGDGGWLVHYQTQNDDREKFAAPTMFVKAGLVIVAAGTLGSTEILLRSQQKGLSLSTQLGKSFTGNGDVLGFGYNCDQEINGVGFGATPASELSPVGPCITSIIDMRDTPPKEKQLVIEEGSIPGAFASIMPSALAKAAKVIGQDTDLNFFDQIAEKAREISSSLRGPYTGAVNNTQTYLIMSHDDSNGEMLLKDDRLRIDWPHVGTQDNFKLSNSLLYDATTALGGEYVQNPIWSQLLNNSLITVHPMGGCVIADNAQNGVTNHKGQVFCDATGEKVYSNLYVSDGAIIPTSLGVNPLLTISALAERSCALIAKDRGWVINYNLPSQPRENPSNNTIGLAFTEKMQGYFSVTDNSDPSTAAYQTAYSNAKTHNSGMQFTLTVSTNNLDQMIASAQHEATMFGTLQASALSPEPLAVSDGRFNLFVINPEQPDTKLMLYHMNLQAKNGDKFYFSAFKQISCSANALNIWHETSTLYVTVYKGENKQGPIFGKGILHIAPKDFAIQMTTLQVSNAQNNKQKLMAQAKFGQYFAGTLWQTYGGIFYTQTRFNPNAAPRKKRQLRAPTPTCHPFVTDDNVQLKLTRYQGGDKGPVMLVHGLGVASSIFSTDLIQTNLVEYLCANDYDVWLLDFRVSIDLEAAKQPSNGDQVAKYDFPAAIKEVRQHTGSDTVQAIVHCYGATTFFMSMLAGLKHVRSIVCSQIAAHVVVPAATKIKTGIYLPSMLNKLGVDSLTAYVDSHDNWMERLYDKALGVYALAEAQGQCNNPVCHRVTFLYASLYRHDQLNEQLHHNLHELFAEANIETLEHLAAICRAKQLVNAKGENAYMPNMDHLNLPICFISGQHNACYLPESTATTFNVLSSLFPQQQYKRHVIQGYGHIDCIFGRNAAQDVYPLIVEHLDKS